MSAANDINACFGKSEMPDFSGINQIFDRARRFFNRHVRINAVLIKKVNIIGSQTFERSIANFFNMFRSAVQSRVVRLLLALVLKPNFVAMTTFSRKGSSASPTNSSFVNGP